MNDIAHDCKAQERDGVHDAPEPLPGAAREHNVRTLRTGLEQRTPPGTPRLCAHSFWFGPM